MGQVHTFTLSLSSARTRYQPAPNQATTKVQHEEHSGYRPLPVMRRANIRALRCLVLHSLNVPRLNVLVDEYAARVRLVCSCICFGDCVDDKKRLPLCLMAPALSVMCAAGKPDAGRDVCDGARPCVPARILSSATLCSVVCRASPYDASFQSCAWKEPQPPDG